MNVDQRLAKENEEIKQLEATVERVLKVLQETEARHNVEISDARGELEQVSAKLNARKTYRQFMEDVINERDEQADDMREAFLSMRSDLSQDGQAYPESVDLLGITLGLDEPAETPKDNNESN